MLVGFPTNQEFTALGTTLFFIRDDGVHGLEIWTSNGTAAGTTLLRDIRPGIEPSEPRSGPLWLAATGGKVYFTADDGIHGREVWVSDGTEAGTRMVADILLRARHGTAYAPPPATGTVFTDVPASHWAAPWIEQLAAEGITVSLWSLLSLTSFLSFPLPEPVLPSVPRLKRFLT